MVIEYYFNRELRHCLSFLCAAYFIFLDVIVLIKAYLSLLNTCFFLNKN